MSKTPTDRSAIWLAVGVGVVLWLGTSAWFELFGRESMGGHVVDVGNEFVNPTINVAIRAVTGLWDAEPPKPDTAWNTQYPRFRFDRVCQSLFLLSGPLFVLPVSILALFHRRLGAWLLIVGGVVFCVVGIVGGSFNDRGLILPVIVSLPMIGFGVWVLRRRASESTELRQQDAAAFPSIGLGLCYLIAFLASFALGAFIAGMSFKGAIELGWLGPGFTGPNPMAVTYPHEGRWHLGCLAVGLAMTFATFLFRRRLRFAVAFATGIALGLTAMGLLGLLK